MKQFREKLHPSSCFPANPPELNTKDQLLVRIASNQTKFQNVRVTFIGVNSTTYSTIAAILASQIAESIECIVIFDKCSIVDMHTNLIDLQLIGLFRKVNVKLHYTQSYWETRDSSIVIINTQHYRTENESIACWTQMNATLVEEIVSEVCRYSSQAILIICTQPNELMTYVASRASRFPSERIFGLGASIDTAYAHKTISENLNNINGRIRGYSVIGNEFNVSQLTIDGILYSDIYKNTILKDKQMIYTDITRKSFSATDLMSKAFSSCTDIEQSPMPIHIEFSSKPRSNWTEALLLTRIIQALINGNNEFQSNFTVNIAPIIQNSTNVFLNYPTTISSTNGAIKYTFPYHKIPKSSLIPFEKFQSKLNLFFKSKD